MLSRLSRVWLFVTPWSSLPGSSVHGILQARILGWAAPWWCDVCIYWERIYRTSLVNIHHRTYRRCELFLWWELLRSTLSNFQAHGTVFFNIPCLCALGCTRPLRLHGLCSGCGEHGLPLPQSLGFSMRWLLLLCAWAVGARGISSCGAWA